MSHDISFNFNGITVPCQMGAAAVPHSRSGNEQNIQNAWLKSSSERFPYLNEILIKAACVSFYNESQGSLKRITPL